MKRAFTGATVFDGTRLLPEAVLVTDGEYVSDIAESVPKGAVEVRLTDGILAPGLLDLQVNGGGGLMVDGQTDRQTLARMCAIHATLGATGILPTLITDRPEAVERVIQAGIETIGTPGFLGLHLEGPHLDPRRKGAHDPALIRPMSGQDLDLLLMAANALPCLMVTVAPSAVTPDQIATLAQAGVIVSLGHSDCTHAEAMSAILSGARCVTHLFNAMSQLGNREPGLVGAALSSDVAAGLIADGIHVVPEVLRIAMAAKPEGVFLVSDCMAAAGTDQTEFRLNGRRILRSAGRLTLEDGTLAGADLTLPRALQVMVETVGLPMERALRMATATPAGLIGRNDLGNLRPGAEASLVHLAYTLRLTSVWQKGEKRL
jgi:N-acetylglucosamine-6-phosphate deacetylase